MEESKPLSTEKLSWTKVIAFGAFAVAVVALLALLTGVFLGWGSDETTNAATWVTGAATFGAAAIALYGAYHARLSASQSIKLADRSLAHSENALQHSADALAHSERTLRETAVARWEAEYARRVEHEAGRRREGMKMCIPVIEILIDVHIETADALRLSALGFDDEAARRARSLDMTLMWQQRRSRIGALTLPIRRTHFVHYLADEVLPKIDEVFEGIGIISDATDPDAILEYFEEIDPRFAVVDELQHKAMEDFDPSPQTISEAVLEDIPPKPE